MPRECEAKGMHLEHGAKLAEFGDVAFRRLEDEAAALRLDDDQPLHLQ